MNTPLDATHIPMLIRWPTVRALAIAALVVNALLWGFAVVPSAPPEHNLPHMFISLVVAGIVVLRFRWAPAFGALACASQLVEGFIFLDPLLAEVDSATELIFAGLFFTIPVVGLVASIAATVQNYRAPRSRPFVDLPTPPWTYPMMVALTVLVLGGILVTAIQRRGVVPGVSAEALAAFPALTSTNNQFAPSAIRVKVGETVALRLENNDEGPHSFDLDELNVHVPMPSGKTALALFTPTQPGTHTFHCDIPGHTEAGMKGTLIVEP